MLKSIRENVLTLSDSLLKTQKSVAPEERPRTYRLFVMDAAFWSGMNTLQSGPFLAAFALAMGATNYEIGLITTIAFFGQLMQVPGIFMVQHFRKRRAISVICSSMARLMWLPIALIPFLFVDRGVTFMLQYILFYSLIGGIPIPSWHSLMKDAIAPQDMPAVLSRRASWSVGVALALTLAGGLFVDLWQRMVPEGPLYAYSILFLAGMAMGLMGIAAIWRLPEPAMQPGQEAALQLLLRPFRDANFLKFLKFVAPWNFTMQMAMPFFLVYLYTRLGFSVGLVTAIVAVGQLSQMFFVRIWSPLLSRYSNKSVISVSASFFLGSLLLWPLLTLPERHALTIPLAFFIFAINGLSMAGLLLGNFNLALKLSPTGQTHSYMTVYMLTVAVAATLAPMLGGTLSQFFAARELSLTLTWSDVSFNVSVSALSLRALDFLFIFAFFSGLFALYRLSRFHEEGEASKRKVMEALQGRLSASVRVATSVENLRRSFPYFPFNPR